MPFVFVANVLKSNYMRLARLSDRDRVVEDKILVRTIAKTFIEQHAGLSDFMMKNSKIEGKRKDRNSAHTFS